MKIAFPEDDNSITHSAGADYYDYLEGKTEIKATWKAPNPFSGSVVFKYTVVMDYSNYYVKLESDPMKIG